MPGFDADMVLVDLSREVKVNKEHINTRSGWSLMEGHTFKGWPVKTILRGKVTAEWAKDSPGMRPVGEPRGKYLRRDRSGVPQPGSMEVNSPVQGQPHRPLARRSVQRPGFSPETLKYTKAAGSTNMAVWDDVLSERDRKIFDAAGWGRAPVIGKRPAIMVIDVNYNFCGDRREPIFESIKRWHFSCGERAWDGIDAIRKNLAVSRAPSGCR